MRRSILVAVILASAAPAGAQSRLDYPVGKGQALRKDSGLRANPEFATRAVYQDVVRVPDAAWLRVYFGTVQLASGSRVRLTSLRDGEVQELDSAGMAAWRNSSAYFNGDTVKVELIAAPRSAGNRMVIEKVDRQLVAEPTGGCGYPCGICGADDRVPSSETYAGRLLPAGCTASVYNLDSCLVSAGHCIEFWQNNSVVQFNVPPSNGNCSLNHPPIADQFPVTDALFENAGLGADWSVMSTGPNNLGQTILERFREYRPIATMAPFVGQPLMIAGYGIDPPDCQDSQAQQTSFGVVTEVTSLFIRHSVDATCGNSGSSIVRNGEIIAIASHCPCPNFGTRMDKPAFAAARLAMCPNGNDLVCPGTGDCCQGHTGPGCADSFCCQKVCECDGFCCHTEWDQFCAGQGFGDSGCGADLLCGVCGVVPANDGCAGAVVVGPGSTPFETLNASTDGAVHAACDFGLTDGGAIMNDVWFEHSATCNGTLLVGTCPATASYNTKLAVYDGCGCPAAGPVVCNDDGLFCPLFTSQVVMEVKTGQCVTIRVGGSNGATGSSALIVSCAPGECEIDTECDDGNLCTTDFCADGKCLHGSVFGPCNDGNACTAGDMCIAGTCVSGSARDCSDSNVCTDDYCEPASGCINDNNLAPCEDGTVCTSGDVCSGGDCQPGAPLRLYGDVDHSGIVDLLDILCVLDGFKGNFKGCTATDLDIAPCAGDGTVTLPDVTAVLDAFQGIDPCCGG